MKECKDGTYAGEIMLEISNDKDLEKKKRAKDPFDESYFLRHIFKINLPHFRLIYNINWRVLDINKKQMVRITLEIILIFLFYSPNVDKEIHIQT